MPLELTSEDLASFTRYSAVHRAPGTPRLALSFESPKEHNIDNEFYRVVFTITRDADDPEKRPCVIHWDPVEDGLGQSGMILHVRPASPFEEGPHVNTNELPTKSLHPQEVSTENPCFKQLDLGTSVAWSADLPPAYFNALHSPDHYDLIWGGGLIHLWDWGTLADFTESPHLLAPKSPAIVLPGGAHQSFEAVDDESDLEDEVGDWGPSPRPMSPSARVPDAPVLSIKIAGPETLSVKNRSLSARLDYPVTVTISYDEAPSVWDDERQIVFRTFQFTKMDSHHFGFRLYKKDKDEWRGHNVNGEIQHHAYQFGTPDMNRLMTLKPGESWSFPRTVTDFPKQYAPGDRFMYGFTGAPLRWWNWGNSNGYEDFVEVGQESSIRRLPDTEGRPAIVVPASNWIEFTLVE